MRFDARQEIENINLKLANIQTVLDEVVKNHLPHIQQQLEQISGRPSWMISAIITFLSSLVALLLTIVLRR